MATPRTATTHWKRLRKSVIAEARAGGITSCPLCRTRLDYDSKARLPNSPEVDHIILVAHGGTDDRANLRVICGDCNRKRGDGRNKHITRHFSLSRRW